MAKIAGFQWIPIRNILLGKGQLSVRSGEWTRPEEDTDEVHSFGALVESIERYGQIDPVGVTRILTSDMYELQYGYRRMAALQLLCQRGKATHVAALIWEECDAQDWRMMQIIHSQTTAPIEVPDLAINLRMTSDIIDPPVSDQQLAKTLGMSPGFTAMLLRIARNASPQLLHHWTHGPHRLAVATINDIVMNHSLETQEMAYISAYDAELHCPEQTPIDVVRGVTDELQDLLKDVNMNFRELMTALALSVDTKPEGQSNGD